MNKTYRTVFSRIRGAVVAASELTKSHQPGKKVLAVTAGCLLAGSVFAADSVTGPLTENWSGTAFTYTSETPLDAAQFNITNTGGAIQTSGTISSVGIFTVTGGSTLSGMTGDITADEFVFSMNGYSNVLSENLKLNAAKLTLTTSSASETGLKIQNQNTISGIGEIHINTTSANKTGLIVAQNTDIHFTMPVIFNTAAGVGSNKARIEVELDGKAEFDRIVVTEGSPQAAIQANGRNTIKINDLEVGSGQFRLIGWSQNNSLSSTFELGTVKLGEGAMLRTNSQNTNSSMGANEVVIAGNPVITMESGSIVDFGNVKESGSDPKVKVTASTLTINVKDTSADSRTAVYLGTDEVDTSATAVTVNAAGENNTGNAEQDLLALQNIVRTGIGAEDNPVSGVTLNQEANEIFDGASAVVSEDGTLSAVVTQANPATHGIAEMTALGVQIWRSEINDMNKRLGELRDSSAESNGVWARVYNGKAKYGAQSVTNKYTSFQFGYDRQVADGVWLGGAFSYTDGNNDFRNGDGDSSLFAFTGYGSWLADNGMFLDVTGKVGRMKNSFDIGTTMGLSSASYHTNTVSMSAEAGWRLYPLANAFFVEPQVEVMYGHVFDADYTTSLGVSVNQDSTDSLIGRAGFALGLKCPNNRGNAYVRASVLHDWKGEASSTFTKNGMTRTLSEDLGDTWIEYGIGANFNATENLHVYADLEATESAKVETSYRFNLGVRYAW